ncbi:hypothetical protein CALVIDRAFT_244494 [Calocera viscosa TUFC12733]|uniref:Uncharacterized protein n=1 Tax=Calocera viscosa (strain TUFC12733) TaxID=1330018 RepID=A0A167JGI3_CALVF|nr:hypothetical protein CALVIDRAFT_244494 [Calocera viscosa TUFC12733]
MLSGRGELSDPSCARGLDREKLLERYDDEQRRQHKAEQRGACPVVVIFSEPPWHAGEQRATCEREQAQPRARRQAFKVSRIPYPYSYVTAQHSPAAQVLWASLLPAAGKWCLTKVGIGD